MVAVLVVLAGVFPKVIDVFLVKFGVHYPPIVVIAVGVGLMLIKILAIDLEQSRQERKIRRLTQRLAMYEADQNLLTDTDDDEALKIPAPGRKK